MVEDADPEDVLQALGKKYSATILGATADRRSAQELSDVLDIPIATSYRRIEELEAVGLLDNEDSVLTEARNREDVYRRAVDGVRIAFGDGTVTVDVEERPQLKRALDDAWNSLPDG